MRASAPCVAARRRHAAVERSDWRRDGGERVRARRVARRRAGYRVGESNRREQRADRPASVRVIAGLLLLFKELVKIKLVLVEPLW